MNSMHSAIGDEKIAVRADALKNQDVPAVMLLSEQSRRMQDMARMYRMDLSTLPMEQTLVLNSSPPAAAAHRRDGGGRGEADALPPGVRSGDDEPPAPQERGDGRVHQAHPAAIDPCWWTRPTDRTQRAGQMPGSFFVLPQKAELPQRVIRSGNVSLSAYIGDTPGRLARTSSMATSDIIQGALRGEDALTALGFRSSRTRLAQCRWQSAVDRRGWSAWLGRKRC